MQKIFDMQTDLQPKGDQPQAIAKLCEGLEQNMRYQTLLGVTGSGKTFTMANVIQKNTKPTLILAHNKTLAAQLYAEMKGFFPNNAVEYFVSYYDYYQPEAYVAASDTYIAKDASINDQIEQLRLSATKSLLERRDVIIIATVSAIYGLGDPDIYLKMIVNLRLGDKVKRDELIRKLISMQYTRNEVDFSRGTFRVRGDLIDIFPAEAEDHAVRIELFDDHVENLTIIDSLTSEALEKPTRVAVYPKTHYVTPKNLINNTIEKIKEELKERIDYFATSNKLIEKQRITERTQLDMEMLQEMGYCQGIENYSRYLSGRNAGEAPPTLMDYLPADSLVFIDESHVTIPQIGAMYKGDRSRKENLVNFGFRLPSALDNRPMKFEEFEKLVPQVIMVSATPSTYEAEHAEQVVEQVVRPTGLLDPTIEIRPVTTQVDDLLSEINKHSEQNQRVLVTTLTKKMAESLTNYLEEAGCKVKYLHSDVDTVERVEIIKELRAGTYDTLIGINLLREGLDIPEVSLVAILDADKEGFLRSERSLIQTIGRAARHTEGKAILYADKITNAIDKAVSETNRRRQKQTKYNEEHGITPTKIIKNIDNMIDVSPYAVRKRKTQDEFEDKFAQQTNEVELPTYDVEQMNMHTLNKLIKQLEKKMKNMASNLEFEKAAHCRDEIKRLKELIVTI